MSYSATKYIPQAAPFVMVDTFVDGDETVTRSELLVREDNILEKDGCLSEAGLVEHIAQTVALHAGRQASDGESPQVGYIGAVKDLKIYRLPEVGAMLQTTITILHQVLGATVIQGETICDGNMVASCEMKIFVQSNE